MAKRPEPHTHLYFIKVCWQDVYKVGITGGDPLNRLSTIQVGCPLELELHAVASFSTKRLAEKAEADVHLFLSHGGSWQSYWHGPQGRPPSNFASTHIRGEWFRAKQTIVAWLERKYGARSPEDFRRAVEVGQVRLKPGRAWYTKKYLEALERNS